MATTHVRAFSDHHSPPQGAASGDTHLTDAQCPVRVGIDSQVINSMPRAEDDRVTSLGNRDTHDRPGSGSGTASRLRYY